MPTIDEELIANSKAKFNADVNVKDFSKVKTEDGTTLTDYIDEHGGSVPENMVTTDTEQLISGKKIFYTKGINIQSASNNSNISFGLISGTSTTAPSLYVHGEDSNGTGRFTAYFPNSGSNELATMNYINKVWAIATTKGDTNIFTYTFTNAKVDYMTVFARFEISSVTYTFSFALAKNSSTCFNVAYGTTSDDVAICKASFTTDKLTIDLDNVNASISKIYASYIFYTNYTSV